MTSKKPRINVIFDNESYVQITDIAAKRGLSRSELVRIWAMEGLNGSLCQDNIDFITKIMKKQIIDTIKPYENRIATLVAKSCVQSGTAAYLSAEAIAKFVPIELQQEVSLSYELARRKAVAYMQRKSDFE